MNTFYGKKYMSCLFKYDYCVLYMCLCKQFTFLVLITCILLSGKVMSSIQVDQGINEFRNK